MPCGKEELKLSLFASDMVSYVLESRVFKKLLELMKELSMIL